MAPRYKLLAVFLITLVAGSVGLNLATGDSWPDAFGFFRIALGIGIVGGVAYYLVRRLVERS